MQVRVDSGHRPVSHCVSVLTSGGWRGGALCAEAQGRVWREVCRAFPAWAQGTRVSLEAPGVHFAQAGFLPVVRRVWAVTEDNHRALRGFRVPGASALIEHTSWGGGVCARMSVM